MTPTDPAAFHSIMTCLLHYSRQSDRGDYQSLSEAFAPDGVMVVGGGTMLSGRAEIAETLAGFWTKRNGDVAGNFQRHHITSPHISFNEDGTADGEIYVLVVTERGPDHAARYIDTYVQDGDRYLIGRREIILDWITEGSRTAAGDSDASSVD